MKGNVGVKLAIVGEGPTPSADVGAELYRVNVLNGGTTKLGAIGRSAHTVTGLAAVQEVWGVHWQRDELISR
jgi:hypothetical protein